MAFLENAKTVLRGIMAILFFLIGSIEEIVLPVDITLVVLFAAAVGTYVFLTKAEERYNEIRLSASRPIMEERKGSRKVA